MDQNPNRLSKLLSVLGALPDRVFIVSSSGQFLDVFGGNGTNVLYSSSKLVGTHISDIMEAEEAIVFQSVIDNSIKTKATQSHVYTLSPLQLSSFPDAIIPTRTQWYEGRVHVLDDKYNGDDAVIWLSRNITDSYELKERLIELSEIDDLTQLLNRRAFTERIKQCFGCRKRYNVNTSIILIDVDYFKSINDNFGHPFGDETLKEIAKILKEEVREVDSVGRLGGEEFSVILNLTDIVGAELTAERIRQRIEHHNFSFFGKETQMTVSIGISHINPTDNNQTDVLHRADAALYDSKEAGRNRVTVVRV